MDTSELRRILADGRGAYANSRERELESALRQAADEIDRLRAQIALYHDFPEIMARIDHANRERDEASAELLALLRRGGTK